MDNYIAIGNNEPTPDNLPDEIKKIINDGKKKAGFNPDGTPMSNQASEDSLRYVLRHTKVTAYAAGKPYVVNLATVIQKEDIDAIQAIIRTEKLKLLAAVRERVVGEDWRYLMTHELFSYEFLAKEYAKAELRASQRKVLDKLEAEL